MNVENWNNKRILLIKLRYIGDTLTLSPVVSSIKRKYPRASISVLINKETEGLLRHDARIDEVILFDRKRGKQRSILKSLNYNFSLFRDLRNRHFDAVIDFTHGDRAAILTLATNARIRIGYKYGNRWFSNFFNYLIDLDERQYHIVDYQLEALRPLGINDFDRQMSIFIPAEVEKSIDKLLGIENNNLVRVIIHPGARTVFRRWMPDRFAAIARRIKDTYGRVAIIFIGGKEDEETINEIEFHMGFRCDLKTTSLDLIQLAAVLKKGHLFIGNDSAPGHIAAAVGCPVISIFGPAFPHIWRPLAAKGEVVFKNLPCCGCRQKVCHRDVECIRSITAEELWPAVLRLIPKSSE